MKILITGGAGYLGTELAYRLAARDDIDHLVIYDNLARGNYNLFIGHRKFPEGKLVFIKGDLLDTRRLRSCLADVDVVYHLAAKVTKPYSDHNPHLLEQVNHWGTAELVYAVEESSVSRLVYVSSSAVYGTSTSEVHTAIAPAPATYYGISKLRGEMHVVRLMQKRHCFIIRAANVYGYSKSMRFDARINRLMFQAAVGEKLTVNGSGEQVRAYIHVVEAVDCLEALLDTKLAPDVYDLVSRNLSVGDILSGVTSVFPDTELLYINQHVAPWELRVRPDPRLLRLRARPDRSFLAEIRDFKQQFTMNFHD